MMPPGPMGPPMGGPPPMGLPPMGPPGPMMEGPPGPPDAPPEMDAGPLQGVSVAQMLNDPKVFQKVKQLASLGNVKAKQLMAAYRAAKKEK